MKKLIFLIALFVICGCEAKSFNSKNNGNIIAAFGDSLTAGNGVKAEFAYPALLQEMTSKTVINLGVSGDTSRTAADRKEEMAQHNPSMVLIEFGANDLIRMRSLDETQTALEEIVDYAQKLGAVAVIVDTGGDVRMSPYSEMMQQISEEKQTLFVPGIMDGIFTNPQLKSDELHPNEEGYKLIAEKIYEVIEPHLN